jgi:hypothetical protein
MFTMLLLLSSFTLPLFTGGGLPEPLEDQASVELVYEVSIGSRSIGELSAVRTHHSDSVVYLVTSDIDANVGIKIVQDYRLESVYRNGTLSRSELHNVINNKVRADTRIRQVDGKYIAFMGDSLVLDYPPVDYSIVRLFFNEPEGKERVFSENFASFLECRREKDEPEKSYVLHLPDRTRVQYKYNEDVCEQFEVRLLIFNIRYLLKRVKLLTST